MASLETYFREMREQPEKIEKRKEKDVLEETISDAFFSPNLRTENHVTEWVEGKKEDIYDAMNKVEAALNECNAIHRLQQLGEDVTKEIYVVNQHFEEALANLEKYDVSKEKIDEYISRRNALINPDIENYVTEWIEEPKKEINDAMNKVEETLNTYNTLAELQALGEDITGGLEVANKYFEAYLSNLEKYDVSKEKIAEYISRRDAIINPSIESKNERTI